MNGFTCPLWKQNDIELSQEDGDLLNSNQENCFCHSSFCFMPFGKYGI
jgi:hypothetical protein